MDVSIITAVAIRPHNRLAAAYEMLCEENVQWEWLIQVDHELVDYSLVGITDAMVADARIHIEYNGKQLGVAVTRMRALARSSANAIQTLDSDDLLLPGSLEKLYTAIDGDIVYAFGDAVDVALDGTRTPGPPMPWEPGPVAPQSVRIHRDTTGGNIAVHIAGLMIRKDIWLAYGGWGALDMGEDLFTFMPIAEHHWGQYIGAETLLYHKHPHSMTANPHLQWRSRGLTDQRIAASYLLQPPVDG